MLAVSTHRKTLDRSVFRGRRRTSSFLKSIAAGTALTLGLMASPAFAQTGPATDTSSAPLPDIASTDSAGLRLNLADRSTNSFGPLAGLDRIGRLDLPVDAVGSTLFKLDLSNPTCLTGGDVCGRRDDRVTLGLSEYITAKKDSGIDLVLRPRASFTFDDQSSSALVGAVVEIGEDLRRGSDIRTNTWYLFAGADAEALTYSPESFRTLSTGNFHLQDRIIVGDAQAGLGYRLGDADVSLSYLRREANAEGFSYNEDAAALSFTWKR